MGQSKNQRCSRTSQTRTHDFSMLRVQIVLAFRSDVYYSISHVRLLGIQVSKHTPLPKSQRKTIQRWPVGLWRRYRCNYYGDWCPTIHWSPDEMADLCLSYVKSRTGNQHSEFIRELQWIPDG